VLKAMERSHWVAGLHGVGPEPFQRISDESLSSVLACNILAMVVLRGRGRAHMAVWKTIALSASLLAVATGFAVAGSITIRSDAALRAGPGADFSAIGHIPGGTSLETTDAWGAGAE
jgi:hypothetical protein